MNRNRAGLVALFGVALVALAAEPAAAQGAPSTTRNLIWGLNMDLLYVAVPITVLVEGILIYTVWRFKNSGEAKPTRENRRLEITWTVATAVILLFVGVASFGVLAKPHVTASAGDSVDDAVHVEVVATTWQWSFNYNDTGTGDNRVSTTTTLTVPANRTIELDVTSNRWIHSFHVPQLGLKQDAIPGQHHTLRTRITEPGTYQLYCAEYCGVGHSSMLGQVRVLPQDEYQDWLANQTGQ
ncbi:MAG: cytochrome c oxidase subunit II [Haloarculaceae archaeon]